MAATNEAAKSETKTTAEFEQTTKGGKRRYRIDNGAVTGTLYVAKDSPYSEHDKLALDIRPAV